MSISLTCVGDKLFKSSSSTVRPLEHSRWYFISRPIPEFSPPLAIRLLSESIIYHYAASPANPSLNIVLGYCHLKLRLNSDDLEEISGSSYQWIPASFANHNTAILGVDFSQFRRDDFDIDNFVKAEYPWDLVSTFIAQFVSTLLLFPTLCPDRDSVLQYIFQDVSGA